MKKAAMLIIVYNVFWGLVQIFQIIQYIYYVNITQNTLALKSFLGMTVISLILVIPLNVAHSMISKGKSLWRFWPYIASFVFVCVTYLVGFAIMILM